MASRKESAAVEPVADDNPPAQAVEPVVEVAGDEIQPTPPAGGPAEPRLPAVRITARTDGFRRCGIAHSASPVVYPAGRWTAEEIIALEAEPQLVVDIAE